MKIKKIKKLKYLFNSDGSHSWGCIALGRSYWWILRKTLTKLIQVKFQKNTSWDSEGESELRLLAAYLLRLLPPRVEVGT